MGDFILKELVTSNIESELEKIGFDIAYRAKASDKFKYKTFKIFNLTIPQANILKQTALSFGADCGVHRDVLTANIEKTNVVLGGSYSQLKKICERLRQQPFSMKILAENLVAQLDLQERKTKLVGILNITPDSFSDGGMYFEEYNARKQLFQLVEDGADVIDIGAESTRPGAEQIDAKIQIERLRPILKDLPEIPISVDTRSSEVAMFALDNGVQIINDVSGMDFDLKIVDVVKNYNASLVIQHSTGDAGNYITYDDVVEDVFKSLYEKIAYAKEKGIKNIIIDPGIGFGKTQTQCFELLNRIEEFRTLKYPIMVGVSRKSMLGLLESNDNNLKDALSLAVAYPLIQKKVDYLRVHNVKLHKQLLNLVM
jgi:dihydropteroate synthase